MLTIKQIKEGGEVLVKGLEKKGVKGFKETIKKIIETDDLRKTTQQQMDFELAEQNAIAKEIGMMFKSGNAAGVEELKQKVAQSKAKSGVLEEKLAEHTTALNELIVTLPNLPAEIVPTGFTAQDNVTVKEGGEMPTFQGVEKKLPHWELCEKYDIIDFELGVKLSGAGFPVYKGQGAKLQRALINFFLDCNTDGGYREIQPPIVVNSASGFATGQLPDKEGQMYHCTVDDLYLIPTAEVPVTNIFRDVIVQEGELPIKLTAYTPCFRREAGSYGKDVRGLNRLHQFDKVEIVEVSKPEESYARLDAMVAHVEGILQKLELPYRILRLCGGDMSFTSALTYDFEVYSAAQDMWLEVSSVSNFESFQANRLKLRYKNADKKVQLAHTLNGSSLALPRIMAALLENNQTNNTIKIPVALQNYTGFAEIKK